MRQGWSSTTVARENETSGVVLTLGKSGCRCFCRNCMPTCPELDLVAALRQGPSWDVSRWALVEGKERGDRCTPCSPGSRRGCCSRLGCSLERGAHRP